MVPMGSEPPAAQTDPTPPPGPLGLEPFALRTAPTPVPSDQAFGLQRRLHARIGVHARLVGGQVVQARQVDLGAGRPAQGDVEVGIGEAAEAGQPRLIGQLLVGGLEQRAQALVCSGADRVVLPFVGDELAWREQRRERRCTSELTKASQRVASAR